jgi:diaminohydroxyphosphoribosylaminopyrimidine deaminase/5-amino-6-(5-phosphoribosylamino)uracil reductase
MKDPNPLNDGAGLRKLKKRGVKVSVGVLEEEAQGLNKPFAKFITTGMPYVTVKLAESIDGKIATRAGDSKWITGPASRRYVHDLRSRVDAVMVGVNTVIKDDPRLTCRIPGRRDPARVIVDSALKTPPGARIFSGSSAAPVYIATLRRAGTVAKDARLIRTRSDHGRVDLKELLKKLARLGMTHILVEGGGELVSGLVEKKLVDEFMFFIAPMIIGGRDAVSSVGGVGARRMGQTLALGEMKVRRFGKDILIEAEVK